MNNEQITRLASEVALGVAKITNCLEVLSVALHEDQEERLDQRRQPIVFSDLVEIVKDYSDSLYGKCSQLELELFALRSK